MGSGAVDVVQRALEAFSTGDRDGFLAVSHDDAEIVPLRAALEDTIYRGPGAPARFWDDSEEIWKTQRLDVEELREANDCVLVIARFRATARQSGAPVDTRIGMVLAMRDGRVARARTYADPESARAAAEEHP